MTLWLWAGFLAFVGLMLWIDLGVINRTAHRVRTAEAVAWTAVCIALALAFTVAVYFIYDRALMGVNPGLVLEETGFAHIAGPPTPGAAGKAASLQFIAAWLIEYSLSLDNIFVIGMIFAHFRVPAEHQHRVLFWAIAGAVALRGILIIAGMGLIHFLPWFTYPLGALLLFSAIRLLAVRTDTMDFEASPIVRLARHAMPVSGDYDSQKFFLRLPEGAGRAWAMTPLMLVLIVVTSVDTLFALDSIPAVFAITHDPFIAFTSNIFAVLGLRSLYFAIASVIDKFKYLKLSLVLVLAFVGLKLLLIHHIPIPTLATLGVAIGAMTIGILASILDERRGNHAGEAPLGPDVERVARLTLRQMRRVVILVVGITVVLVGLVMIGPIPGPGILVVPVGLGILAAEFVWARHLLALFKQKATEYGQTAETALMKRPRPWVIPLVFGATASLFTGLVAFKVLTPTMAAIMSGGILLGQVLWANSTMTRYRKFLAANPGAAREDSRPPLWMVPVVIGATVGLLVWLMYQPWDTTPNALALTAAGLLTGEAVWGAMWIALWLKARPRDRTESLADHRQDPPQAP
jgi:tellurite resistance protein TerC